MELMVAAVTASVTEVVIIVDDSVADTVVVPCCVAVATPCDPAAFDTSAIDATVEPHVTIVVRSRVVESLYVPVATSWRLVPLGSEGAAGEIARDTSTAGVTVSVVVPERLVAGSVAVIVVDPGATPEATPLEPALLEMVATVTAEDAQVT
jgi:hypothetical protein